MPIIACGHDVKPFLPSETAPPKPVSGAVFLLVALYWPAFGGQFQAVQLEIRDCSNVLCFGAGIRSLVESSLSREMVFL